MSDHTDNPYAAPQPPNVSQFRVWGASICGPSIGPTQYRCRRFVRWMQYALPCLMGAGVIGMGWLLAELTFADPSPFALYWKIGLWGLWLLTIVQGIDTCRTYYRWAGVSVVVDDSGMVYRSRTEERRLPFDRWMSLESYWGTLRVHWREHTVRLTLSLEGIGHLVSTLKAGLDARGLTNCYDRARLYRFFKSAEGADQAWRRLETIAVRLVSLSLIAGGLGVSLVAMRRGNWIDWMVGASGSFLPLVVYCVTETVFQRRFTRGSDKEAFTCPAPDPVWEAKVYRTAFVGGLVLHAACAIALLAFV